MKANRTVKLQVLFHAMARGEENQGKQGMRKLFTAAPPKYLVKNNNNTKQKYDNNNTNNKDNNRPK
jgi:hypothetical protein